MADCAARSACSGGCCAAGQHSSMRGGCCTLSGSFTAAPLVRLMHVGPEVAA